MGFYTSGNNSKSDCCFESHRRLDGSNNQVALLDKQWIPPNMYNQRAENVTVQLNIGSKINHFKNYWSAIQNVLDKMNSAKS